MLQAKKKAEKESFAEAVLILRKLFVGGGVKTNSKREASVEGVSHYIWLVGARLFV